MWWTIVGIIAACLTMFGFVPQIVKMKKTKSVKDVSVLTFVQFKIGLILWILYGIHLKNYIIIGANAVTLTTLIIALVLYIKIKAKN